MPHVETPLAGDVAQVQQALWLPFFERGGGETNTRAALNLLHTAVFTASRGDRLGVPNRAVVITDGQSNVQQDRTLTEAAEARRSGVELFVVGVGEDVNVAELHGIASTPGSEHVLMMRSTSMSSAVANTLLDRLCR